MLSTFFEFKIGLLNFRTINISFRVINFIPLAKRWSILRSLTTNYFD